MEISAIRNELNELLRVVYSQYDPVGSGSILPGEKLKQFTEDFELLQSEGETLEGFKSKFWKEFNKLDEFTSILNNSVVSSITNKSLTLRVNNDETKISKTSLCLTYEFQREKRQTLLNDIYNSLDANDLFLYVKLYSEDPSSLEEPLDNIIKLLLILGKSFFPAARVLNYLSYNIVTSEDFILIKFMIKHPLIQMFHDTFLIVTKYFQHLEGKATISIETTSCFEDLIDNLGEDVIKTFLNGSKLSLNISTNCYYSLIEVLKKFMNFEKKHETALLILSLLEFNADFSLKMGEVEKTVFWNKIPDFKPFSAQNTSVKSFVNKTNQVLSDLPIFKKLLELFEKLKGKLEISLNCAWGLLRLKFETNGLMEIWNLLKTIHYN